MFDELQSSFIRMKAVHLNDTIKIQLRQTLVYYIDHNAATTAFYSRSVLLMVVEFV